MMCPRCGSRNIEVETIEAGMGPYPDRMLVTKRCLDCVPCDWCAGTGIDREEFRTCLRVGPPECRTCRGSGYVEQ